MTIELMEMALDLSYQFQLIERTNSKYLLRFKQTDSPPDADGDVDAGYNSITRTVLYSIHGYGLQFSVLHEVGHCLNGDRTRAYYWTASRRKKSHLRHVEKAAWMVAAVYCPDNLLEEFTAFANRCMATYEIKPVTVQTVKRWRKSK